MNYAMASLAAMTGNAYDSLPPTPVVFCADGAFLAGTHLPCGYQYRVSRLAGKEPMLTRSKIVN
ncbi:Uncharacterised protein [Escherichia coli]|nr:Uncharacterised protein [Escherichia coli]